MATESVTTDQQNTDDAIHLSLADERKPWFEHEWKEGLGDNNIALMHAVELEKAIHGFRGVSKLLSLDAKHKSDVEENSEIAYEPLTPCQTEDLRFALEALDSAILTRIENFRASLAINRKARGQRDAEYVDIQIGGRAR